MIAPKPLKPEEEYRQWLIKEYDALVAKKFGVMLVSMPSRNQLKRPIAIVYIVLTFYRRLFMAIAILFFFEIPTVQILITLFINLFFACFTAGTRLFESPYERRTDIFN